MVSETCVQSCQDQRILYSRSTGVGLIQPVPVVVLGDPHNPPCTYKAMGKTYTTKKGLLADLTGHPEGRHWTFDRYFRLGRYGQCKSWVDSPVMALMDTFGGVGTLPRMVTGALDPKVLSVAVSVPLGIDLGKRHGEVVKLVYAGFGREILSNGYDHDDVMQEVFRGILVRNRGKCPWDARKSSFGHYVHLVAKCVLSNYHRKMNRQRRAEVLWDGESDMGNVGVAWQGDAVKDFAGHLAKARVDDVVLKALPFVVEGYDRTDIAAELGLSKATVSRALASLRRAHGEWALGPFLA